MNIEQQIEDLLASFRHWSPEECVLGLTLFLHRNNYQPGYLNLDIPAVIRARKITGKKSLNAVLNEIPGVQSLGLVPIGKAALGRCNLAGESVFYCGTDSFVPIAEVRPEKGDNIVVTTFGRCPGIRKIKLGMIGAQAMYDNLYALKPNDPFLIILAQGIEIINSKSPDVRILDRVMADLFNKDGNEEVYKATTYFFKHYQNRIPEGDFRAIEAMLYPSVQGKYTGGNIAMTSRLMKNSFRFNGAVVFFVEDVDETGFNLRRVASVDGPAGPGKLKWRRELSILPSCWIRVTDVPDQIDL